MNVPVLQQQQHAARPRVRVGPAGLAADISNWQGELTPEKLAALKASGIKHLIIRASIESPELIRIARQQIEAVLDDGEVSFSAYDWCYWDWKPEHNVDAVANLLGPYRQARAYIDDVLWLDEEDPDNLPDDPAVIVAWLHRARAQAGRRRYVAGHYTSEGFWREHVGNTSDFADDPLWLALWDGKPDVTAWTPFGGWRQPRLKQYTAKGRVPGFPGFLDLDVIGPS